MVGWNSHMRYASLIVFYEYARFVFGTANILPMGLQLTNWHFKKLITDREEVGSQKTEVRSLANGINLCKKAARCTNCLFGMYEKFCFYFRSSDNACSKAGPRRFLATITPFPSIKKLDGMLRTP